MVLGKKNHSYQSINKRSLALNEKAVSPSTAASVPTEIRLNLNNDWVDCY